MLYDDYFLTLSSFTVASSSSRSEDTGKRCTQHEMHSVPSFIFTDFYDFFFLLALALFLAFSEWILNDMGISVPKLIELWNMITLSAIITPRMLAIYFRSRFRKRLGHGERARNPFEAKATPIANHFFWGSTGSTRKSLRPNSISRRVHERRAGAVDRLD